MNQPLGDPVETGATSRQLGQDLALGLRLAVPCGRGELLRCAVLLIGVAGCVATLLYLAALPGAIAARQDREIAITPTPTEPTAGWTPLGWVTNGQFVAAQWELAVNDRPLRGYDLFAPDPAAVPPPPGVTTFPRPGELWVSPALDRLLREPGDVDGLLEGTVVGVIGADGLLGPDDRRFYRGTATPTLPSLDGPTSGTAAIGWGHATADWETRFDPARRPLTVLLITGGIVTGLVAGGALFLLSRLDGGPATRRVVALRLLGLSSARCRRIGAIRGLAIATVAVGLGVAAFSLLRAAAGGMPIGPSAFYPGDLTVPIGAFLVITAGVGLLMAHRGARPRPAPDPAGAAAHDEPAPPRPYGAQLIVMLGAGGALAMAVSAGLDGADRGRLALGTMALAGIAVLAVVAVPVPWLVDTVVDRPTVPGDPRERRALSRPLGAAAGLLTAVLVLQATADARDPYGGSLTGARADLVATAGTGLWVGAAGTALLLVVGTVLATERLGPARRPEVMAAALLPTALGVVLAVPTATAMTWLVARATDLPMTVSPSATALGWAGGALGLVLVVARTVAALDVPTRERSTEPRPAGSR